MSTDLVGSIDFDHLLKMREETLAPLFAMRDSWVKAQSVYDTLYRSLPKEAGMLGYLSSALVGVTGFDSRGFHGTWSDESLRAAIDGQLWSALLNMSGMRSLMTANRKRQIDEDIDKGKAPEFTRENIEATFSELRSKASEMLDEGVVDLFKQLSWEYKSNSPVMLAPNGRIVIKGLYSMGFINQRTTDLLDDIDRLAHVYAGKPEPAGNTRWYCRISEAERVTLARSYDAQKKLFKVAGTVEGPHFSVKVFLNGNAHVHVTPWLREELNAAISRCYPNVLPCADEVETRQRQHR